MSYVLWAISSSFAVFVLSRVVCGISKGNVSLSIAVVADVFPQEKRGKGMVRGKGCNKLVFYRDNSCSASSGMILVCWLIKLDD